MNAGQTIFSQLMDFLPTYEFNCCVRRYCGNRRVRQFSCRDQFLSMAFAQLTYRESLRDIQTCLRSMGHKLYHAGFRTTMARNTLAKANETRDWRIYADFAAVLIRQARRLYINEDFDVALEQTVYAFDSTTIDLCLSLFPWAQFRRHKSAVKLHTLIDLRGNIPCFVHVSSGAMADVSSLDLLPIEAGSFYVMDRGYTDFERLYRFTQGLAFFVTRAKRNLDFARQAYRKVDKSTGLRSDQTITLCGPKNVGAISRPAPPGQLPCRRHRQAVRLSDQQLRSAGPDDRSALQVPLAGRAVLQVDQAVPADQGVLRHVDQRREDAGVDCRVRLRAGGHRQEGTEDRAQHGRHPANHQHRPFRENAHFAGVFARSAQNGKQRGS